MREYTEGIGRQRMNWLALTGIRLSVKEAVAWGLSIDSRSLVRRSLEQG